MHRPFGFLAAICCLFAINVRADVSLPAIFSDHMVLQRQQPVRVWGRAEPSEKVIVEIASHKQTTSADESGRWQVTLSPLTEEGPHELVVAGKNRIVLSDVLVGEVWLCSGQSNMEWALTDTYDGDLEQTLPKNPRLRLITVPHHGTQEPQETFKGAWQVSSPESIKQFSAVGYFFGKQLADTLDVPVGLIDNSWGGSACEAWIDRKKLAENQDLKIVHESWADFEKTYDYSEVLKRYESELAAWKASDRKLPEPRKPGDEMKWKNRPGNLYNGVLLPIAGYGMRGAIWYQGESNAGRAYQYREMFPTMIQNWRDDWKIGDFPFYWVQLADFKGESREPIESDWAELREAQSLTLGKLNNVGQAVIVDLGNGLDIHPRKKRDVGLRLARIALAKDYGKDVVYEGPRYNSHEIKDGEVLITFDVGDHRLGSLRLLDRPRPLGFTIAGEDRKFDYAAGRVVNTNQVELWSEEVKSPVAVRYAWADNPVCNLVNDAGLPATPFRTDDWPGVTFSIKVPEAIEAASLK